MGDSLIIIVTLYAEFTSDNDKMDHFFFLLFVY